jgi:competence ComEA-like helix-hairpin-helix protein
MLHSDFAQPSFSAGKNWGRGFVRPFSLWGWLAVAVLVAGRSGFAQLQREGEKQEPKWEILTGCRLMTNAMMDGDSFHVLHDQREYIFRLYFVDSPETDATIKDRIKDQAAYFGIATEAVPRAGVMAARFTREQLTGRDFTIMTRWQNAMGRSSLARYYGVVLVNGTNLIEKLVANGLARIYGFRANWPEGPRSTTFINKLKNLELTAREKKLGVWDEAAFPRATDEPATITMATAVVSASRPILDVNTATVEELRTLPGIGPKLAERIIAHRPFKSVADLDLVPGIGPVTLRRLEPLVRVTSPLP